MRDAERRSQVPDFLLLSFPCYRLLAKHGYRAFRELDRTMGILQAGREA